MEHEDCILSEDGMTFIRCKSSQNRIAVIPDGVTLIMDNAFNSCIDLTEIMIPYSVIEISDEAFARCTSCEEFVVDDNNLIYCSKDGALYSKYMSRLIAVPKGKKSIDIPNGVTKIEERAFKQCSNLLSIKFPSSMTEIGGGIFKECTGLKEIVVDSNNPNYCSKDGVLYSKDMKALIAWPQCKDMTKIPSNITKIGDCAFQNCTNLTSIVIPKSVTEIGWGAFCGCTSLTSIEIPNSVTKIGRWAFDGCTSLTSIEIPDSVTVIGGYAFAGCSSLTWIEIPSILTAIGGYAFPSSFSLREIHLKHTSPVDFSIAFEHFYNSDIDLDLSKITLYVPKGSGEAYRDHKFYKRFKEIIEE